MSKSCVPGLIRENGRRQKITFPEFEPPLAAVSPCTHCVNMADKQVGIEVSDRAKQAIIDQGFDPSYGARPLKRFIQRKVETLVAKKIIAGEVEPESIIKVDYDGNNFAVS